MILRRVEKPTKEKFELLEEDSNSEIQFTRLPDFNHKGLTIYRSELISLNIKIFDDKMDL